MICENDDVCRKVAGTHKERGQHGSTFSPLH